MPSPQLVGTPERATLDLNVLRGQGVEVVGRLAGIRDGKAQFSGSLRNVCALADLKMNRLLASIDEWAERNALAGVVVDFISAYATYTSAPVLTRTAVTGVVPVERVWVFGQFGG